MVHVVLGAALFEADQLVPARQHIVTGQELCERAGLRITMLGASEWYEVLGLHLLGDPSRAWQRLEAIRRDASRAGIERVAMAMTVVGAELLLLEGDPAGARDRLETLPTVSASVLGTVRDRERLARARVLAALGRPEESLRVLGTLADDQRRGARHGRLLATLAASAWASQSVGDGSDATAALEEALLIAAGEGYRRAFLDPVLPLGDLLRRARHIAPAFVDSLLPSVDATGPSGDTLDRGRLTAASERLVEPLTVRELEVLRLVVAGLSNDEIGSELYVTSGTAKWHVHNVIAKLGARNRVTVAARARELGLA